MIARRIAETAATGLAVAALAIMPRELRALVVVALVADALGLDPYIASAVAYETGGLLVATDTRDAGRP